MFQCRISRLFFPITHTRVWILHLQTLSTSPSCHELSVAGRWDHVKGSQFHTAASLPGSAVIFCRQLKLLSTSICPLNSSCRLFGWPGDYHAAGKDRDILSRPSLPDRHPFFCSRGKVAACRSTSSHFQLLCSTDTSTAMKQQ